MSKVKRLLAGALVFLFLVAFTGVAGAGIVPGQLLDVGRFNEYEGTIDGQYKIRMLLFPQDNKIVGNYFYEAYETKIKLTGVYDGDNITLYEYDDEGTVAGVFSGAVAGKWHIFSGVWQSKKDDSRYNFRLQLAGTFPGRADNIYIDAGARSTEEVERFARELKDDILNKNKSRVAEKIHLPISVFVDGQLVEVTSRQEFIELFDKIFYYDYVKAIAKCFPLNMSSSYKGIMFGDKGQIWLKYVFIGRPSNAKLWVTALNNDPKDMAYFLQDPIVHAAD
jgi:hypothetical protein